MDELYLEHILEHYRNPQNKLVPERYDVTEDGANPNCGDAIRLYVTFAKDGTVGDVAFTGDGCAISVAATSLLTERAKGMRAADIDALTPADIHAMLGVDVGPGREKCALLSLHTLKQAIAKKST